MPIFVKAGESIRDLDGAPIKQRTPVGLSSEICPACGNPKTEIVESYLTVGEAIVNSLNGVFDSSAKLHLSDKLDRFQLAVKIHKQELPVEISNKEKDIILKLINECYPSPVVVARVSENIVDMPKGA